MAETIDDKVHANTPPSVINDGRLGNEKQTKKPKGTLDSFISETFDLFGTAGNLAVAGAAPALGYAITGNAGIPVVSAAFVAGSEGSLTSKKIKEESLTGAVWGTILHYFTLPMKLMSNLAKAAYMGMLPFVANSVYPITDHLIKNKTPIGLGEKLKKNYWSNVKKSFKTIWPITVSAALFFTQPAYIVGSIGLANYLYRKIVVGKKDEEKKETDKTPYQVAAANVSYKLIRNTTKGLTDTIYAFGKTIDSYLGSSKAAAKSSPVGGEHRT